MSTPEQQEDARKTERGMAKDAQKNDGRVVATEVSDRCVASNQDTKFLIAMELDRRKFVRDVMIDRWIAGGAIVLSLASLVVSVIALSR
jgi:hypothetical protein